MIPLLLVAGADIEVPDDLGNTPLAGATSNGHEEIVKLLLEAGANLNTPNNIAEIPVPIGPTILVS